MPLGDVGTTPSPFHGSWSCAHRSKAKTFPRRCSLVTVAWWPVAGGLPLVQDIKNLGLLLQLRPEVCPKMDVFFCWNIRSSPVSRNLLVHIFRCWLLVLSKSVSDGSLPVIRVYLLLEKRGILCITRAWKTNISPEKMMVGRWQFLLNWSLFSGHINFGYCFLGGGFKYFLFSSLFGEDFHFD